MFVRRRYICSYRCNGSSLFTFLSVFSRSAFGVVSGRLRVVYDAGGSLVVVNEPGPVVADIIDDCLSKLRTSKLDSQNEYGAKLVGQ